MKVFAAAPFLRILLPFGAGILMALHSALPSPPLWLLATQIAFMSVLLLQKKSIQRSRLLFMLCADIFLFLYGCRLVEIRDLSKSPSYYGAQASAEQRQIFVAVVTDLPVEKEKHIKIALKLLRLKSAHSYKDVDGNLIAYVKKSAAAARIAPAQVLLISSKFLPVQAPANPHEFDYRSYLHDRQIYHTVFVDSTAFARLPVEAGLNPIWTFGLRIKSLVLRRLENSGLSPEAYAICSALLTGYDDDIDRDLVNAFAHSGTLHVLSVSGLHTGLIFLVLNFLFDRFDRKKQHKRTRFILITFSLWFFALVTGFAAPVLRAVIMFNLLGLGNLFFRSTRSNHLNLLFVSAFILLNYNPFLLHDLGFLLSYSAMVGLICLQPRFSAVWRPLNPFLNYIWQSVTASAAATISTLPLTLFFFKQFPLWFFISNIVVVPLSFLILMLAAAAVLSSWLLPALINKLVTFLVSFIQIFDSDTYGYVADINFNSQDLIILSLLTFLIFYAIEYRSARLVFASLLILGFWQICGLVESWQAKNEKLFVVYESGKKSIYALKNRTHLRLDYNDENAFNFRARPQLVSFSRPEISEQPYNFIASGKEGILLLREPGRLPEIEKEKVSTLVVFNDFQLDENLLIGFNRLKLLVADGSNSFRKVRRLRELCLKFGIEFYDTRRSGAFQMALQ